MSLLFFLSSDDADLSTGVQTSDDFTIKFESPIELGENGTEAGKWKIGLVRASCWYSWANVDQVSFSNGLIQYNNGVADKQFTIPTGTYNVNDLNAVIQANINALGDVGTNIGIVPNFNTGKITVTIAGGFNLDLSVSNFFLLLGFDASQVVAPIVVNTIGNNLADITRGVDNLLIRSSLVTNSYIGSNNGDGLYAFQPDKPPHSSIDILPPQITYVDINEQNRIDRVRMFITDQLERPIDFRGETTTYLIHLIKVS